MFSDLLGLAWQNMQHARVRLLMTAVGVLVGTAAVVLLVALTNGLQRIAETSVGGNALLTEVTVYPALQATVDESRAVLDDEAIAAIREIDGVLVAIPLAYFNRRAELVSGNFSNYADLYGIAPQNLPYMDVELASGELALPDAASIIYGGSVPEFFLDPNAATYEPRTLDVYTESLSLDLLRFDGAERSINLQATGVLEAGTSRFDNAVFMSLATVLDLNTWLASAENFDDEPVDIYNQVLIRTTDRRATRPVTEAIRAMGYETDDIGDFLDDLNNFFGAMRFVFGLTGGIALLVSAFVVANTMMMSVVERTSTIGLMKALGARNRDVLAVFLFEAGIVGFGGGIGGVLVALLLSNMVNQALLDMQNSDTSQLGFLPINSAMLQGGDLLVIPLSLMLFAIGLATLVGLISGFFPAWYAARLSPVTALRR